MSGLAVRRKERVRALQHHRMTLENGQRGPWNAIQEKGLVDDVFTMFETEGVTLQDVADFLLDNGIHATTSNLFVIQKTKKNDWLYMKAQQAAMEQCLQSADMSEDDETIARKALQERLTTLMLIGDMSAKDLIQAKALQVNQDRLVLQKMVAQRQLYELQLKGAEFVAEVLKDEAKAADLRERLRSGQSGEDFIQAVRARVYGNETVAKPADWQDERQVDGEVVDAE